jgi:hypothetical protein
VGEAEESEEMPGEFLAFHLLQGDADGRQDDEGKAVTEKDVIHLSFEKISHGKFPYVESRPLRKDRLPARGHTFIMAHSPRKSKKQKPFSPIPGLCYKPWNGVVVGARARPSEVPHRLTRVLKICFIGAHKSFSTMHRLASLQRQNSR